MDFEYILSIDMDDDFEAYRNLFRGSPTMMTVNKNRSAVDAINQAAKQAKGDLLIQISEDFYCFPDWGKTLLEATQGKDDFLLKTNDGTQGWIVTLPIMDRRFYESNGYFYNPDFLHQFVDTHLTHLADITKRLIFRNDILFEHRHYTTKKTAQDELNRRADKTWAQGKSLYLQACRDKFGTDKNIWDITSPYGNAHKAWLRQHLT